MSGVATFLTLAAIAAVSAISQYLLKTGLDQHNLMASSVGEFVRGIPRLVANPQIVGAVALYGAAIATYIFLLSRMELNRVVPVAIGLNIALVSLVSWRLLGEPFPLWRILGLATIVAGTVLVVWS